MILTTHLLIHAIIGSQISNPAVAFIVNLLLHYLLDMIPHWDYIEKILRKDIPNIITDFIIGCLSLIPLYYFFSGEVYLHSFVWGAFAGVLPDLLQGMYHLLGFKFLEPHQRFHTLFHFQKNQPFIKGFSIQLLLVILGIVIFL